MNRTEQFLNLFCCVAYKVTGLQRFFVLGFLYTTLCVPGSVGNVYSAEPDLWFPVGEELVYDLYWGFIPVGKTRVTTAWVTEDDRQLLAIRFRTKSNRVIASVYPVDDLIESIIDPETFLPIRFTKRLKEGRYRCDETTTFDFEVLKAHWISRVKDQEKEYPIHSDTRDLVSFMYYMRSKGFQVGNDTVFQVMADEKLYSLFIKAPQVEKIRLKRYGKIPSLKIEPTASFKGLFVRKGKMQIWISEDDRHLMTKIVAKTPFADVNIKLAEVHGPGDDFWVQTTPKKKSKKRQRRHGR
ncbi:MAG: DUF3108 domain-containing protein [Kiritimatiellae bacterium]|nr:DUF3108 domain-containing protein [Kiritimatiellia bacterium]